ncbi:MAG: oligosaccharide flippase family protein [Planctomycetes bacterium]|nr:oligosaccharide flippase family protein [Planctomycetota bacterium]
MPPADVTPEPAPHRRVRAGTVWLVLGRTWGSACTFAYLWLLAHALADAAFGRLTFYLAVFLVLDSLVDLGTGAIAVQRTADDEDAVPEVLAATRRIRLVAGLAGVALVGGTAFLAGEPGAGWILLASLYPLTHVLELSATVYRNRIAWRTPVVIRAGASALSLALVVALLAAGAREPGLFLCGVAAGSASANLALHLAARRHLPHRAPTSVPWREVLRPALPLGIAGLCQQTYFYVDNLFVRAWRGDEVLGHYNVAVRLMSFAIMVGVYAALVSLPWFRREHARGALGAAVTKLTQPLFATACLGVGVAFAWTGELLGLFGPEFREASGALRWLLGAAALVYVGANLLTAVVATGRTGAVLVIAAGGLALNLAGNAWLVPTHGMDGAALATFATELWVAVAAFVALARGGARELLGAGAWRWLGGPAGFALGAVLGTTAHRLLVG